MDHRARGRTAGDGREIASDGLRGRGALAIVGSCHSPLVAGGLVARRARGVCAHRDARFATRCCRCAKDSTRLADTSCRPSTCGCGPGGAASIGFHIRHTGRGLDCLLTYARAETLSDAQRLDLQTEEKPGHPPVPLAALIGQATASVDRGLVQLRATDVSRVFDGRRVGRAGLPSTVLGLIVHAAEHSTRTSARR